MQQKTDSVALEISIVAPQSVIFQYVCSSDGFAKWFGEGSSIEPRPGGAITICYPNGEVVRGEVREVRQPSLLRFTFGYADGRFGMAEGSTTVEIQLTPTLSGTLLRLRHEGIPTDDGQRQHLVGWRYHAALLVNRVSEAYFSPTIPSLLDAYFAAWNAVDNAERDIQISHFWTDQSVYRDAFARSTGIGLSAHIVAAQAYAHGATLTLRGKPDLCQEYLRFGWESQGSITYAGECIAQLNADGKMINVASFWGG